MWRPGDNDTVTVVSVDPGKWLCGVAVWRGRLKDKVEDNLLWAGLVETQEPEPMARWCDLGMRVRQELYKQVAGADLLVMEQMQVYAADGARKADALLDLAGVAGAVAAKVNAGYGCLVLPSVWKGQISRERLTERERMKWPPGDKRLALPRSKHTQSDVFAAISLGRWWWDVSEGRVR